MLPVISITAKTIKNAVFANNNEDDVVIPYHPFQHYSITYFD